MSMSQELGVNEYEAPNGTRVLFQSNLSRGYKKFDLSIYLEKWEAPQTLAAYLRVYAEMLEQKKVVVNETDAGSDQ